jgi:UDP-2,3-diacylglucosamine pyrophosphatase LpxH
MSKLDEYRSTVEAMKAEGKSNREIAAFYDTSEKSVRRALKRWARGDGVNFLVRDGKAVIETQSIDKAADPVVLMKEVGLSPDDWHIESVDTSKWGRVGDPQFSLKLHLKALNHPEFVLPAAYSPNLAPRKYSKPEKGESELVVFASDFHAPFHDPTLFRQFIDWLALNQPHKVIVGGDLGDFPEQSRHRHKPEWQASAQKCVNTMYQILLAIRMACPNAEIVFLPGNHDERIRNAIIDNNAGLFELRPADEAGESKALPVWDLRSLLHLDKLGVSYIDPMGTYEYALHPISSKLAGTHGWIAKNKSGYSAAGTLESLGHSVIVGHTHRRGFYYETTYEIDGTPRDLVAVEAGCMCLHKKGLGYARAANWQQGFVTAVVHEDGTFAIEPAVHVNGKTLWRGQVYV